MPLKIAILSGKGGVGKSTITCILSHLFSNQSPTLLIDTDLCGPSTSFILNCSTKLYKANKGIAPAAIKTNLELISMALMINPSDSVIWRAPKKISAIKMFFESINHEVVLIDTPPGVSEEHLFVVKEIDLAIIVTTSQNVSLVDAQSSISLVKSFGVPALLIENMTGIECINCNKQTNVFSKSGGRQMADKEGIEYLCTINYDKQLSEIIDNGKFIEECEGTETYKQLKKVLHRIQCIKNRNY